MKPLLILMHILSSCKLNASIWKYLVVLLLACITLTHINQFIIVYVKHQSTIAITAAFYSEKQPLIFPSFQFCFNKLFTYSRLHKSGAAQLFKLASNDAQNVRHNELDTQSPMDSESRDWKIEPDELFLSLSFGHRKYNISQIFQAVHWSNTQTCFTTRPMRNTAIHTGRYNTLDLVISASVFDDIPVYYADAPLTVMNIIPFKKLNGQSIPDKHNVIHVSVGRLSAIGLGESVFDSTFRSKSDERSCTSVLKLGGSRQCSGIAMSGPDYYQCVLVKSTQDIDYHEDRCVTQSYIFGKSEAKLKYDSKLSTLGVSRDSYQAIQNRLVLAGQLDSQVNPTTRASFKARSYDVINLTQILIQNLRHDFGFKCDYIHNKSLQLITTQVGPIPSVVAERAQMRSMSETVAVNEKIIWKKLFPMKDMYMGVFDIEVDGFYLPYHVKNAMRDKTDTDQANAFLRKAQHIIPYFGGSMNAVLQSVKQLQKICKLMIHNYNNLHFTNWISTYVDADDDKRYRTLLQRVIAATDNLSVDLFYGKQPLWHFFAHDEDDSKKVFPLPNDNLEFDWLVENGTDGVKELVRQRDRFDSRTFSSEYQRMWEFEAWATYKGFLMNPSIFEVIESTPPPKINIPIAIYLYCMYYVNWLAVGEQEYVVEPSFSLDLAPSASKLPEQVVIYLINEIFSAYESYKLVSTETDGILGLERKACRSAQKHNLYMVKNVTVQKVQAAYVKHREAFDSAKRAQPMAAYNYMYDLQKGFHAYEDAAHSFAKYYKDDVSPMVNSIVANVVNFRKFIDRLQGFKRSHKLYKPLLINRLVQFSNLVEKTEAGGGEQDISLFLAKKGTILSDEVQMELDELQRIKFHNEQQFLAANKILKKITQNLGSNEELSTSITKAAFGSIVTESSVEQRVLITEVHKCTHKHIWKSRRYFGRTIRDMQLWIGKTILLTARAKRYMASVEISKEFMEKNMMHVQLYYDSLTVVSKKNIPVLSTKQLFVNIATILSIYLDLDLFIGFDYFCFCIGSVIALVVLGQRRYRDAIGYIC